MNNIQINNIVIANNDDQGTGVTLRQINFGATFSDSTHISGFITMSEADFQQTSYAELKSEIQRRVVTDMGGSIVNG